MTSANDVLMGGNDPFINNGPTGPEAKLSRDRWGRPRIVPPGGGKLIPYTRTTRYVGCLEDTYNLGLWEMRQVAHGMSQRPDLVLSAGAHYDDRDVMDDICKQAKDAAKASAAATTGTALHRFCERIDRGEKLGHVPAAYREDLKAYERITREFSHVHLERFMVQDELKVGGTPDRLSTHRGALRVNDIKTGSLDYGQGKIAMQLAMYAHSVLYALDTDGEPVRTPIPDVDLDWAVVVHLPAGTGTATLHWVDIRAGWEAVQLATRVREWRARKGLMREFARSLDGNEYSMLGSTQHLAPDGSVDGAVPGVVPLASSADKPTTVERLDEQALAAELIGEAPTEATLGAIWRAYRSVWTPELTVLAKARKQDLTNTA